MNPNLLVETYTEAQAENRRLREALEFVIENSGSDISYSWGLIKLRQCRAEAFKALKTEDPETDK